MTINKSTQRGFIYYLLIYFPKEDFGKINRGSNSHKKYNETFAHSTRLDIARFRTHEHNFAYTNH